MSSETFVAAQRRLLDRYQVDAKSVSVGAPAEERNAHVLVAGSGSPVVMLNGIGTPAAIWAPLMAQLGGFQLHAVDLPGFGLTVVLPAGEYRASAVRFVEQVLDGLGLDSPMFVSNSLGSLWTMWFAMERPERVTAMVHVGCPALILETSAPLPMRMLSMPMLGKLMTTLQPPSHRQVRQLSKMVNQFPLAPDVANMLLETERLPGFDATFLSTLRTLLRFRGARPGRGLTTDDLGRVHQPTQLIWGDDDPMGSVAVAERAAAALRDATLHVVAGGHAPWLTEAETIGEIAREFLGLHAETNSPEPASKPKQAS